MSVLGLNLRISLTAVARLRRVLLISLKTEINIRSVAVRFAWTRPALRTPMCDYSSLKHAHGEQEEPHR